MSNRRIELTISSCKECPYRVKWSPYDYTCTRKSLSDGFMDQGTGFKRFEDLEKWEWEISIPNWCTLPYESLA